jgi:hypothetical protein
MTAFYKIIIVYDLIICIETFNIPIYGRSAERRPLTAGAVNTDADVDPAISPDGRRLAFVRIITLYSSRVMWMPLGAEYRPAAQLREIGTPGPSLHFRSGVIRPICFLPPAQPLECCYIAPTMPATLW